MTSKELLAMNPGYDPNRLSIGEVLTLSVTADGYLYHMVRILAGTVLQAGQGKLDPAQVPAILASRDRCRAGPTMPARGLFLWEVCYPGLENPGV